MIKSRFRIVSILILLLSVTGTILAQSENSYFLKPYNESIFIISNYSGDDSNLPEAFSISELLTKVDGFRFSVSWDLKAKRLTVRNPDGSFTPLFDILVSIRHSLEADSTKILTLFVDFTLNIDVLADVLQQAGINQYLYEQDIRDDWPSLQTMINSNHRLVVFNMQENYNSPVLLHFTSNYSEETGFSSSIESISSNEIINNDFQKSFLIFNGYNSQLITSIKGDMTEYSTQNPDLIELFKNAWINTGKTPNFIMLNRYTNGITLAVNRLKEFNTIKGTVTYNSSILKNVNWQGLNNVTSGKFSFVITPGEELTLNPSSPGYEFSPESITVDESNNNTTLNFKAALIKITDNLEAFYEFNNTTKDYSPKKNNGKERNLKYKIDATRGVVASFDTSSLVSLSKASTLNLRDHDFTVATWLKVSKYQTNRIYNFIISSKTSGYLQGLHLVIKNKHPYLGFFNNDLEGKTIIEEGQWYHIVWRYNKLSEEQAIYVNGRLDAISSGRPSYKGSDSLYIGAHFSQTSNFLGEIDNLGIWSRALGEEEILGLSNQTINISSDINIPTGYPVILLVIICIVLLTALFLVFRKIRLKTKLVEVLPKHVLNPQIKPETKALKNYIKLFGDFKVFDNNGNEISGQFTPKLKQLFLLILVHSHGENNGIITKDLSDILWKNQSPENTKNIRGVTIRNLRLILEKIDEIELVFQSDKWSVRLSENVHCDYLEFLALLNDDLQHDRNFFKRFYEIIKVGEIFKGESYTWFDDFKGYIENRIVDFLLSFISELSLESDSELILKLADQILLNDPINDSALSIKMKALIRQNNNNLARYTYERFCSMYEEVYGEKYLKTFNQLIS